MVILPIPHVTQQGNTLRNDCAPACVAMLVHALTDQRPSVAAIAARGKPNDFVTLDGVKALLRGYGVPAEDVYTADANWYKAQIDAGLAPIGLFAYHVLPAPVAYRWAHFMVVIGYDDTHFYVHDPLQLSGPWALPVADFVRGISTRSIHPYGLNPAFCAVRPLRSVLSADDLRSRLRGLLSEYGRVYEEMGARL